MNQPKQPASETEALAQAGQRARWLRADAMRNLLVRSARKAAERRFTGEPITGFGALEGNAQ